MFSLWCFSDGALRDPRNALKSCVHKMCSRIHIKQCAPFKRCVACACSRSECKNSVQEASARNMFKKRLQNELHKLAILVDETHVQEDRLKKHVQKMRAAGVLNMKGFVQDTNHRKVLKKFEECFQITYNCVEESCSRK